MTYGEAGKKARQMFGSKALVILSKDGKYKTIHRDNISMPVARGSSWEEAFAIVVANRLKGELKIPPRLCVTCGLPVHLCNHR